MRPSSLIPHSSSFILLLIIGLVLAAPLLQGETLCTDDGALHIFRTVALDRAIKDGNLYPRWFPDLAYGYGFPFFVFREPLGYYALEALHLLGFSVPNAFNLVLAGSLILSGVAMYALARDIFGERGGLLAGIAYLSAPYTLIGPLVRGNLPEVIAFVWMPLILFFFRRLVLRKQARWFVASVLSYAALFLTHNISSLLFTPLLLAYVALLGWVKAADGIRSIAYRLSLATRSRSAISHTRSALLAIVLTLGLTAFFWLPALVEQGQVQLYLTHSTRGNDYHFNFIGLDELLAGPGSYDPNLLNPPLRIRFGWVQLALAAAGVLAYRRARTREQCATIAAAAVATIALAFMALPASLPAWDNLPLIRFVQFPWRFVGRAMLPAALLAAAIFSAQHEIHHQDTKTPRRLRDLVSWWLYPAAFGLAACLALLFAAPLSYPRSCPTPHALDMTDVFAYERGTGHIGVDPLGAYLPRTVIERPTGSPLEAQYASGEPIQRFDATSLPAGARLLDAQYGPNRAQLMIATPVAFTATYLAFDFPGWAVQIDGQATDVQPSDPTGLITFEVPAGEHRIEIAFGNSPPRTLADGISLAALFVFVGSVVLLRRRSPQTDVEPSHAQDPSRDVRFALYAWLALAAYLAVKLILVDADLTPLRSTRLRDDALAGVAHPLDATFGDRLRLLGYDVTPEATRPGDILRVDLYWKALRPLDASYQAEVGLADAAGWPWSPKHAERPRDFNPPPAAGWPVDAYAVDSFEVEVLPGTPPGAYALAVQIFDRATLAPLPPSTAALPGQLAAALGPIQVDRADREFDAGQLRIYGGERRELDAELTLLGYNIDRVDTVPGESVLLTFFWQARQAPQTDRVFRIEQVGAAGEAITAQDHVIGGDGYPTSRWQAGEQIVSRAVMRVPAATRTGEYHWRGSLLDELGQPVIRFDMQPAFRVTAPERTFEIPEFQNRVGVEIDDLAALLGYDLASNRLLPGGRIDLTLYWQARAETASAFKVFVHVLDAEGRTLAQADAVPGNEERPTTGWLPGEVIADRYTIALPGDAAAGTYQLVAGLYDAGNGARLTTADGSDHLVLTTIEVK